MTIVSDRLSTIVLSQGEKIATNEYRGELTAAVPDHAATPAQLPVLGTVVVVVGGLVVVLVVVGGLVVL